jgi:hypothetical protein
MDRSCEELMDNIEKTLHECRDNKRTIVIAKAFDVRRCDNVAWWSKNIKDSIPLKIDIKNPILQNKYSIEYKVEARSLVIS